MSPAEQAAVLSTCYDGHEGTVGTDKTIVGIRNADPSMYEYTPTSPRSLVLSLSHSLSLS